MKQFLIKLFLFSTIIIVAAACGNSSTDNDCDYPDDCEIFTLSNLSAYNYPVDTDIWVITDREATTDGFEGLRAAIKSLESSDRHISLIFPNLKEFPEKALSPMSPHKMNALASVSAHVATSIGDRAFLNCYALTNVSTPKASTIGEYAFCHCESLISLSFPNAISVEERSFQDCEVLTSVELPKIEQFRWNWIAGSNKITKIAIKNKTYSAENGAFYNADKSVLYKYIGMDGVTEFTDPYSVKEVEEYAFGDCTNLTSITLSEATTIGEYAFGDCTFLTTISLPKASTIGEWAFSRCSFLTTISLPEAISIGYGAFYNCNMLNSISLPEMTTIEWYTFYDMDAITTISLPKATTIGESAFEGCDGLTSISLPEATIIGNRAFNNCSSLTTLSLNNIEEFEWTWIEGSDNVSKIVIKDDFYFLEDGIYYNSDKSIIGKYIGIGNETEFTAPNSVIEIEFNAFADYHNLNTIILPNVETLGGWAFNGCSRLSTLSLPRVKTIGDDVLSIWCKSLSNLEIATESKLSSIGDRFLSCVETEKVDLIIGSENEGINVAAKTWNNYKFKSITVR